MPIWEYVKDRVGLHPLDHVFNLSPLSAWVDEDHVLFVGKRGTRQGELWELDVADGTVRTRGIDGWWLRDQLAISPDRGLVAVTAVGGANESRWNVWVYSLSAMIRRRLTTGDEGVVRSWR